jgi:glutamyl-tRNA synthetase
MKVSHVLRGIEWLPSAPIHVLLYEALGWELPIFAHFPVVNGADGKKLSKRTGAATSRDAREKGFLPEATLNFVSLIGWAPGEGSDQEIFTRDELIQKFSLEGINQSSGIFDMKKMEWMNGLYIRKLPLNEFIERAQPFLKAAQLEIRPEQFAALAPHVQERTKLMTEIAPMVEFLCDKPLQRDMEAMFQKGMDTPKAREILERTYSALEALADFSVQPISDTLRQVATDLGLKPGNAFVVLRVAVTGKTVTPPLFESFAVLGKAKVLQRITETLALLPQAAQTPA